VGNCAAAMSSLADESLGLVIVDDDAVYRELLSAAVGKLSKFAIFEADSGDALEKILATERIDCVALDYDLGVESGLLIKQRIDESFPRHAPIILMTGVGDESTAVRAFRMGMADYLPKRNTTPQVFVETVVRTVERERKALRERGAYQKLMDESAIDAATGVDGYVRLDERLKQLALLPPDVRAVYAIFYVELAEYQEIIKRFNFKTADQALRVFADNLRKLVRPHDVISRYIGGSFIVIANMGGESGQLEKLRERFSQGLPRRLRLDVVDISLTALIKSRFLPEAANGGPVDSTYLLQALLAPSNGEDSDIATDGSEVKCDDISGSSSASTNSVTNVAMHAPAEISRDLNRRSSVRQRVFKRGIIRFLEMAGTLHCTVRNVSTGGAGLRIDSAFGVPEFFDLEIIGSGEARRVQKRWQTGLDFGVKFVDFKGGGNFLCVNIA
jgi:CheY-like chemotaxis protein